MDVNRRERGGVPRGRADQRGELIGLPRFAHQRRRLDPAGDVGRVRVVVVGDQELDGRSLGPFFSTPRTARPSAFIATSNVAIFRAWLVSPSATNQRVLPWKALASSSDAVTTRKPAERRDVFERGELGRHSFARLGREGEQRLELELGVGRRRCGDVGHEDAHLVRGRAQADRAARGGPSRRRFFDSRIARPSTFPLGDRLAARPSPLRPASSERAMCQLTIEASSIAGWIAVASAGSEAARSWLARSSSVLPLWAPIR